MTQNSGLQYLHQTSLVSEGLISKLPSRECSQCHQLLWVLQKGSIDSLLTLIEAKLVGGSREATHTSAAWQVLAIVARRACRGPSCN